MKEILNLFSDTFPPPVISDTKENREGERSKFNLESKFVSFSTFQGP